MCHGLFGREPFEASSALSLSTITPLKPWMTTLNHPGSFLRATQPVSSSLLCCEFLPVPDSLTSELFNALGVKGEASFEPSFDAAFTQIFSQAYSWMTSGL